MIDKSIDPDEIDGRRKFEEYLGLVEARVLKPLANKAIQKSCTATLLLAFAAVDALGKLIHSDDDASPGVRFKAFLRFIGTEYEERSEELWKLRNALVHNAINVEAYLSSSELGECWVHLQTIGGSGLIYVNTGLVSKDLEAAFRRLTHLLRTDGIAAQRADDRLECVENTQGSLDVKEPPSKPSQVKFVYAQ